MRTKELALELRGISKSYGGARALRDGNLKVAAGTIHGVVGPNGAGKSTLIKVASGQVVPDGGEIRINGSLGSFRDVPAALKAGIVAMPQELTIVPEFTVAENITLGREPARLGMTFPRNRLAAAHKVLKRMGVDLSPHALAGDLEPANHRVVMLARAMHTGAHTIILDEPTAALSAAQAEVFLRVVEGLRSTGVAVVYISHRFGELERLCDEITVVRDGCTVDQLAGPRLNQQELVAAVVTKGSLDEKIRERAPINSALTPLLATSSLSGERLHEVDLEVRPGEILGVCGLPGSGVNELMEILGGSQQPRGGSLRVEGKEVSFHDPSGALASGVSYLPVERARAGMLDLSIRANLVTSSLSQVSRLGFLNAVNERRFVKPVISELGLGHRVEEPLRALSGGNRQKVLLSRSLLANARVLILDDPTVGVDVGARHEIHTLLAEFVAEGRAVVVAVSEPEELVSLADRVLVFARGEVAAQLKGAEITSENLVRAVTTSTTSSMAVAEG